MKSVRQIADKDIKEHLNSLGILDTEKQTGETWVVRGERLFTPEQTQLNKELGIHKVNKHTPHNKNQTHEQRND